VSYQAAGSLLFHEEGSTTRQVEETA
jgi:hypothetical protein